MRGERRKNPSYLRTIRLYPRDWRTTRRCSPYVRTRKRPFVLPPNCHRKIVEAAKELGGFDNLTARSVWEIMKAEVGGVNLTFQDAESVLGMLQFMFPEYAVSPPPTVTFGIDVKSEVGSCEEMLSDFGKLELAPRGESSSCDPVNDFEKLKLAPKTESSSCDTMVNEFGKFNI